MRWILFLVILFFSSILSHASTTTTLKQWEQKLIGKKYVPSVGTSSSSKNEIHPSDLPVNSRVIKPDSVVTLDYIPDRLNLRINEGSVISSVFFG
ncbi:hypothetical protein HMI56_001587 [Coelomomyces lativittatus]|nr:hypothetical protein HMI56_001587 [Coelomomyces lativittatus]